MKKQVITIIGSIIVTGLLGAVSFNHLDAARVTYPINELGGCKSKSDCRAYCDIPDNRPACWSYGEFVLNKNVLGTMDPSTDPAAAKLRKLGVTFPVTELGNCSDVTQCRAYCETPANRASCTAFAATHRLVPSETLSPTAVAAKAALLLSKAKTLLGCDSVEVCKALCYGTEHQQQCAELAREINPSLSVSPTVISSPQPYSSIEPSFCDKPENIKQCIEFAKRYINIMRQPSAQKCLTPSVQPVTGKPICTTATECRSLCEQNPTSCPGFSTGGAPGGLYSSSVPSSRSGIFNTKPTTSTVNTSKNVTGVPSSRSEALDANKYSLPTAESNTISTTSDEFGN